jgi:hypothetical protein
MYFFFFKGYATFKVDIKFNIQGLLLKMYTFLEMTIFYLLSQEVYTFLFVAGLLGGTLSWSSAFHTLNQRA